MDEPSSGDQVQRHLLEASEAIQVGDWGKVDFHLSAVKRAVVLESRITRRPYDVEVAWQAGGITHRNMVRVFAASRVLAHDAAQTWAREGFELPAETRILSSITDA